MIILYLNVIGGIYHISLIPKFANNYQTRLIYFEEVKLSNDKPIFLCQDELYPGRFEIWAYKVPLLKLLCTSLVYFHPDILITVSWTIKLYVISLKLYSDTTNM